ncbi:hypothetical protein [Pandoraea norimbergensis]|uniref:hypothetical protein n=1 Tax=Pandoraea norimbergensis TaxID=93219 RepID=UPI001428D491|nr:hypothetical protein [Pandoraea norimbergensis]
MKKTHKSGIVLCENGTVDGLAADAVISLYRPLLPGKPTPALCLRYVIAIPTLLNSSRSRVPRDT